tara:strand:+ start:15402 stop:15854 length:453 start_codon:yes stop_codon:yes gene_type:complete
MSGQTGSRGAGALAALLENNDRFGKLADRDFAAAAGLLVRKLMISAGQTRDDMIFLRGAVGQDIFESELKSLSAYHARLLARRLDKHVDDYEVSTAGAAAAHIRKIMSGEATATEAAPDAQEDPPEDTLPTDDDAPKNTYFGRKSFRTGN